MDQFHDAKGADVSRWLSLHTGAFFGLDRKTDRRRSRLWNPRICITGGIQPAVLSRVLTVPVAASSCLSSVTRGFQKSD